MSAWRERSEAGAPRPRSVVAVVRAVRSSLRLTHAAECVLLFAAGWLGARCALLLSPGGAGSGSGLVAGLCAALCAVTWWLEHGVELAATARALDERLRHHGALATAFELEHDRAGGALTSMEELVCQRVLARLRTPEAVRALFPPLLLPLGAPSIAALCLLLLTDARRAPAPAGADHAALAEGLARALAVGALDPETAGLEGADEDGGLSRAQVEHINRVLQARSALPFAPEEWARAPEEVRARVEELDRSVAELAREVAPGSELHQRLEEARTWLDALRTGLPDAPGGVAGAGTGAGDATAPPADGTITGSKAADDVRPTAPETVPTAARPAAPALGLQAGNWWPSEYDAVVENWIELSRAAEAGAR